MITASIGKGRCCFGVRPAWEANNWSDSQKSHIMQFIMEQVVKQKEEILDEFDIVAFECNIDRVFVGRYNVEGNPNPYKLTFALKDN